MCFANVSGKLCPAPLSTGTPFPRTTASDTDTPVPPTTASDSTPVSDELTTDDLDTTTVIILLSTEESSSLEPFSEEARRPGSWEEDDMGPAYRASDADRLLVALSAFSASLSVLMLSIVAVVLGYYKRKFKAWLWPPCRLKERVSPPPVLTLSSSATGDELFSSSASEETVFMSPPTVLVHRQQDGSAPGPAAAAGAAASTPSTSTKPANKKPQARKKRVKVKGDLRRSPRLNAPREEV